MAYGDKFKGDDFEDLSYDPIEQDFVDNRNGDRYDYMEGDDGPYLGKTTDDGDDYEEDD